MAEIGSEIGYLLQDLLSADNEANIWVSTKKISKMPNQDFFKLVNEKVMVIFNSEDRNNSLVERNSLMVPEECSDPYIRLELMCFKYIFRKQYTNYDYDKMWECVFTAINEIDVDKYISSIQGSLFNSHAVINMFQHIWVNRNVARQNGDKPSVLQVECCTKLLDLSAQAILIDIRCIFFEKMNDICLVFHDIEQFIDFYIMLRKTMLDVNLKYNPQQTSSVRSALTAMSKWIPILEAKLLHSRFNYCHWSVMICKIESLKNSIVMDFKPLCPELSLQMFHIKREYSNFYADYPREPYHVTCERSTDENHHTFELVVREIREHMAGMYFKSFMNVPIRGLYYIDTENDSNLSDGNEDILVDEYSYIETDEYIRGFGFHLFK